MAHEHIEGRAEIRHGAFNEARANRTISIAVAVGLLMLAFFGAIVVRYGRRLDTTELVEQATGAPLAIEPFLRYVAPLARASA